jgi:hypothetical protein
MRLIPQADAGDSGVPVVAGAGRAQRTGPYVLQLKDAMMNVYADH